MQYSKFLKGAYDSSSDDEVQHIIGSCQLLVLNARTGNEKICDIWAKDQDEGRQDLPRQDSGRTILFCSSLNRFHYVHSAADLNKASARFWHIRRSIPRAPSCCFFGFAPYSPSSC